MLIERVLRRLQLGPSNLAPVNPKQRAQSYPHPYPNAWYRVCDSDELRAGETFSFEGVGEQLVAFRTESGTVSVIDAYCPHLGAHLAAGEVKGECIECPFHRWQLGGDGRVMDIPYEDTVQKSLRTRAWPVLEQHGMVFFYYRSDRAATPEPIEPDHPLNVVEDVVDGSLSYRGRYDAGTVDMHLIEFAENSVDFAHFEPLHGAMLVPFLGWRVPGVRVIHAADWKADEEQSHLAYFLNDIILSVMGREIEATKAKAKITFYGPGSVVSFRISIPELGDVVMFQTHTPVEPLRQRVMFRWYSHPRVPRMLAHYVVGNWIAQWRADINIWENKVYKQKPMLVSNDGPVHRMRRWYRQFYSGPDAQPMTHEETQLSA